MEKKTLREIFSLYTEWKKANDTAVCKSSFHPVKSIIYFIENKKKTEYLTQSIFNEWYEEKERKYAAMTIVRSFLNFARVRGFMNIKCPKLEYERHPQKSVLDKPLKKSVISGMLKRFFIWRKKSAPLNKNYKYILVRFNNYCHDSWKDAKELTDKMIEDWCTMGENETAITQNTRIAPVTLFLKYALSHGWINVRLPKYNPAKIKKWHCCHIFTSDELRQLFAICDSQKKHETEDDDEFRRRKLVFCVIYRFMYSTGMRLTDTISLKREDVDLDKGYVTFDSYNGRKHYTVAIHFSLLDILRKYDSAMNRLLPRRTAFFPNRDKKFLTQSAINRNFVRLWAQVSEERASVSDFRITYTVENINSWDYDGTDWTLPLLRLSRSMGHHSMTVTQNYMSLVPRFGKTLSGSCGKNLDKLLPKDIKDIENEEESKQ